MRFADSRRNRRRARLCWNSGWRPIARLLADWGGLTRYGSEDSELKPPAPGENRVVFIGDQITEFWGRGGAASSPAGRT